MTFDGAPAPLLYASDRQINTIVPFEAAGVLKVCVRVSGNPTNCMDARIRAASPGIFTLPITPGMQGMFAAAVNEDGTVNSEGNPCAARFDHLALCHRPRDRESHGCGWNGYRSAAAHTGSHNRGCDAKPESSRSFPQSGNRLAGLGRAGPF